MANLTQTIQKSRLAEIAQTLVTVTTTTETVAHNITSASFIYGSLKTTTTETVAHSITSASFIYGSLKTTTTETIAHSITSASFIYGSLKTTTTETVAHSITSASFIYSDVQLYYLSKVHYDTVLKQLMPSGIESLIESDNFSRCLKLDGRQLRKLDGRIIKLLTEMFPDTAVELLSIWEALVRNVIGVSTTTTDIVYSSDNEGKIEDRQNQVVARLTSEGQIKKSFYNNLAGSFGITSDITEYFPSMVDRMTCGERLLAPHSQWYFCVRLHDILNREMKVEEIINEMKPAHAIVFFTYPLSEQIFWNEVHTIGTSKPNFVIEYAGYVYTHNGTQLIRSNDGLTWNNFNTAFNNIPICACVFKEKLYIGTQTDFKIWEIIDNPDQDNNFTNVFTASNNPTALETFGDMLYLGTLNLTTHYRTNGKTWETITSSRTGNITSLREFDGYLYAGVDTVGIVYKGDGLTWSTSKDTPALNVQAFEVYDDYLYVGSEDYAKIWRYDGTTWTEVSLTTNIRSFAIHDEQIYGNTTDNHLLRSSSGPIWHIIEDNADITLIGKFSNKMIRVRYDNPNYIIDLSTTDKTDMR